MPVTGLFFLPAHGPDASPTQEILSRLTTDYNPGPLPPWSLSHRLFRDTPQPPTQVLSKPNGPRYLQVLNLSHHSRRTHVAISSTHAPSQTRAGTPASSNLSVDAAGGEPATIVSIPSGPPSEEFVQLVISKFGPLWQQRQVTNVGNGLAFEIGDFKVRVGEVRQGSAGGAAQMGRGAVCEVQWDGAGDGEGEDAWEAAEGVIRGFWDGLGLTGARECFWVPGLGLGEGTVRQWCELLRIRG